MSTMLEIQSPSASPTASSMKTSKLSLICSTLTDMLSRSTFHSIPNIVKSKYISVKLMWLACFLLMSSYCSFLIYQTIVDYLKYEVVSITRENFKNPISFPVISICNSNFFSATIYNTSNQILNFFNMPSNNSLNTNTKLSYRLNFLNLKLNAILMANHLNKSMKENLGFTLNQTIISCVFKNEDCNMNLDFISYFDPYYGNCFKFNFDQNKFISASGSLNGLQLELFAHSLNESAFTMFNGYYIFITNDMAFNSYNFDGVLIPTGYLTNIVLSKYSIKKVAYPFSNCISDLSSIDSYSSAAYKLTFKNKPTNLTYSFYSCYNMCFQMYAGVKCGCYGSANGPFPNNDLKTCSSDSEQVCEKNMWSQFIDDSLITMCDCPYTCDKTDYTYTTSMAGFPTRSYADYLLTDPRFVQKFNYLNRSSFLLPSYDEIANKIASVNIFYNELLETMIIEQPKESLIYLISYIGGLLSLFLGISFLSFVEFFEFFLHSIFLLFDNHKAKIKAKKLDSR